MDNDFGRFYDMIYGASKGYAILVTLGDDDAPSSARAFEWPKDRDFMVKYSGLRASEDLYCSTSLSSTENRDASTATVTHVAYSDGDTCPPEALRLPPTALVETSPGHWHYWWALDEEVTAQQASDASRRISYAHREEGMDLGFARAKILRVPGTANTKYDEDFPVTVVWSDDVYTLDTINDVYSDIELSSQVITDGEIPDLLPQERILELEEELEDAGLTHLYLERPQDGQSWAERLFKLELELFRLGFNPQEVYNIARLSASNKFDPENAGQLTQTGVVIPKRNDPEGYLWRDVQRAMAEWEATKDVRVDNTTSKVLTKPEFLTMDERKYVLENPTFVDEYTAWVAKRTDAAETYQRSLAFMLMSTLYGGRGYVPVRWSPRTDLNLFMLILGDTTQTRKSTAKSYFLRAVHAFEAQTGEKLDIGSEATAEALVKTLGERDGQVSVLHKDEVVGMFREFLTKNYMSGAVETFTELYDGQVPVTLRATKGQGNQNRARTIFNFVGVGIRKQTAEVLTKSHFESGFLARMLWSVADPKPREVGSEDLEYADEQSAEEAAQFDAEIFEIIKPFMKNLRKFDRENPAEIRMDPAALKRYNQWAEQGMKLAESYGDDGVLIPSFQRMKTSIVKAAALLTMHEGHTTCTLKHLLPTLAQAELWFNDMVRMAAEVSSSEFERRCNDIENYIASGENKMRLESSVRKRFARYKPAEFDEIVRALQSQGRIRKSPNDRQKMEAL